MEKETFQFSNRQEYIETLDSVMPDNYIMKRNLGAGKTATYLPVPIQEAIADMMFQEWNIIDEKYDILINEIVCTVKISYVPSYPGANEQFCTGSAAIAIQMDSKSTISDFPKNKKLNALEYNLPGVRKRAEGTALENIGNIFGRNIGRKLDKDTSLESNFKIRKYGNKEKTK